jgi:hypothetical protein
VDYKNTTTVVYWVVWSFLVEEIADLIFSLWTEPNVRKCEAVQCHQKIVTNEPKFGKFDQFMRLGRGAQFTF